MGYRLFFAMLTFLTIGCSSPEKPFDDIEFVTYNWRMKNYKNPELGLKWEFRCYVYALIDKDYQCKVVFERTYPKHEIKYCRIDLDKKLIDSIVNLSLNYKSDTDFRPKHPLIYDGPSLKIKINKNNESKTIHYYNIISTETEIFVKLAEKLDFKIISESNDLINDTLILSQRRSDLMKFCIKSDSILRPPPPPPTIEMIRETKFRNP